MALGVSRQVDDVDGSVAEEIDRARQKRAKGFPLELQCAVFGCVAGVGASCTRVGELDRPVARKRHVRVDPAGVRLGHAIERLGGGGSDEI